MRTHGRRRQRGKEESMEVGGSKGKENWNRTEMMHELYEQRARKRQICNRGQPWLFCLAQGSLWEANELIMHERPFWKLYQRLSTIGQVGGINLESPHSIKNAAILNVSITSNCFPHFKMPSRKFLICFWFLMSHAPPPHWVMCLCHNIIITSVYHTNVQLLQSFNNLLYDYRQVIVFCDFLFWWFDKGSCHGDTVTHKSPSNVHNPPWSISELVTPLPQILYLLTHTQWKAPTSLGLFFPSPSL